MKLLRLLLDRNDTRVVRLDPSVIVNPPKPPPAKPSKILYFPMRRWR